MEEIASLKKILSEVGARIRALEDEETHKNKLITYNDMSYEDALIKQQCINISKKYVLITITFDPKVLFQIDDEGQFMRLKNCLNLIENQYFACFERHKSGVLHSHIMTCADIYELQPVLKKMLKLVSKSINLLPAIKCDFINKTEKDYNRTFTYIIADKPNHPKYKYFQFKC
jgi:hypothetical protein